MTDRSETVVRWSLLTIVGMWVGGIASVGGLVAMFLIAIEKVMASTPIARNG
jgi:prolipoprotein diacylglyceryltransferase